MRLFRRSPQTDTATDQALTKTKRSFFGRISGMFAGSTVDEALWESLEEVLIGADAGVSTTMTVLDNVRSRNPRTPEDVRGHLRDELVAILEAPEAKPSSRLWDESSEPVPSMPAVV